MSSVQQMFGKVVSFNVTCQYVWKADGLTCRWNTSRKMANFQECCMMLPVGTGRRSRIQPGTYIMNRIDVVLLQKGLDFQEMFGQIAGLTPTFDQLILLPKFILAWSSGC